MGDVQQEQASTLELSPNSVAETNNEKGKIKGDSSNKEAKETGKDTRALTKYLASQSFALGLTSCSPNSLSPVVFVKPEPGEQGHPVAELMQHTVYSMPAWYIHSHYAWVIFITQGHFSFTYT